MKTYCSVLWTLSAVHCLCVRFNNYVIKYWLWIATISFIVLENYAIISYMILLLKIHKPNLCMEIIKRYYIKWIMAICEFDNKYCFSSALLMYWIIVTLSKRVISRLAVLMFVLWVHYAGEIVEYRTKLLGYRNLVTELLSFRS